MPSKFKQRGSKLLSEFSDAEIGQEIKVWQHRVRVAEKGADGIGPSFRKDYCEYMLSLIVLELNRRGYGSIEDFMIDIEELCAKAEQQE
jgi:hypothetical protein